MLLFEKEDISQKKISVKSNFKPLTSIRYTQDANIGRIDINGIGVFSTHLFSNYPSCHGMLKSCNMNLVTIYIDSLTEFLKKIKKYYMIIIMTKLYPLFEM